MESTSKAIKDAVEGSGLELEFRNNYSGRGMFGNRCVGVVGDRSDLMSLLATLGYGGRLTDEQSRWVVQNAHFDGMGRNDIMYWEDLPPIADMPEHIDEWGDDD